DAVPTHSGSDFSSGLVLADIAGFKPRHDDLFHAGAGQRFRFPGADQRAFPEHQIALPDRVHRGGADRLADGNAAELHAASAASSGEVRSAWVISAMMATAISAGDTAPIGNP